MLKTSEAQRKASKKYREKNRAKVNYNNRRRDAKAFVKMATLEDLEELKEEINIRENEVKKWTFSDWLAVT